MKKIRKQECTHVDHNWLDDPLPFKNLYTNIVDLWLHRHAVDFKTSIILI